MLSKEAMDPLDPRSEQARGLNHLIHSHVERLGHIVARAHSVEELESDVVALIRIIYALKSAKAAAERAGDGSAERDESRQGIDKQKELIESQQKDLALLFNKSNELLKKSQSLTTKSDRQSEPGAAVAPGNSENRILAKLPKAESEALLASMDRVMLGMGEVLYQEDRDFQYVYFPETAIVSLFSMMENGSTVGVGMIGSEGLVGIRVLSEALMIPYHAVAQVAGSAMRIKAFALREAVSLGSSLQPMLFDYTQGMITQISQLAACNQLHSIEQKLIRWLLMMHDRTRSDSILLTQDMLASMIGARRSGVSLAAATLQEEGLIQYRRGLITVLDRKALESAACECYGVIKRVFNRLTA